MKFNCRFWHQIQHLSVVVFYNIRRSFNSPNSLLDNFPPTNQPFFSPSINYFFDRLDCSKPFHFILYSFPVFATIWLNLSLSLTFATTPAVSSPLLAVHRLLSFLFFSAQLKNIRHFFLVCLDILLHGKA